MRRKSFIFKIGNSVDVDKNMNILIEENYDPDIWLGMLELDVVTEEYNKRKEYNIENIKEKKNKAISNTISKIIIPTIATIIIASLGLLPGLDGLDYLHSFKNWQDNNNNTSITANLDEIPSMDIVFNCRVLDGTKTLEIDNFAVTRKDNSPQVVPNTIAPGTSGEFMIEIDAIRNGSSTSV